MFDVISMGEIMMRLTPPVYQKIIQTTEFSMTYGGGEANVMISLSHFRRKTGFMSVLPNNQLGDGAIKYLKGNNINTDYIVRRGNNLGIYFLETGFGGRGSQVVYNRDNSSFNSIKTTDFDLNKIFSNTKWFHISGITLALSDNVRNVSLAAVKAAKENGVTVSFDFNFRSKLWSIEESRAVFKEFLPYVDICFTSIFDATKILEIESSISEDDSNYEQSVFEQMISIYNLDVIIGTKRKVFSANNNSLKAFYYTKNEHYETEAMHFNIVDRIGGGDAFAAGVIHSFLKGDVSPINILRFGLSTSVLKHTIQGDACLLSEDEVYNFIEYSGSGEVKR